jgi:predicted RNA-binding Zn ribbon-like protein
MSRPLHGPIPSNPSDHACVDLVNSTFTDHLGLGEPVDRVASAEWQRWFFRRHGMTPRPGTVSVEDLIALRSDLRRVLEGWSSGAGLSASEVRLLDRRVRDVTLRQRVLLTRSGIVTRHEPVHDDWAWVLARITGSAVDLVVSGDRERLKTCANPACSWMFYDGTVNRSKQFCSTSPCASLARVRRFRQHT